MLDKILRLKEGENSVKEFISCIRRGIPSAVFGVSDAFKNFLVSAVDGKIAYVVRDFLAANQAVKEINEFSGKSAVYIPSKDDALLSARAFSRDNAFARITALHNAEKADVMVVTPETLMQRASKITAYRFNKDDEAELSDTVKTLVAVGYVRTETVESKGTFSLRGDVLDIFPINSEIPYRLDFFGDTIESIKKFDPETRKSLGYVEGIEVLSAVEDIVPTAEFEKLRPVLRTEVISADPVARTRLKEVLDDYIIAAENNDVFSMSSLSPMAGGGYFIDLIDEKVVVLFDEGKRVYDLAALAEKEFTERFEALRKSGEVFSFANKNQLTTEEICTRLKKFRLGALQTLSTAIPFFNPLKIINPSCGSIVNYQLDFKEVYTDIENWLRSGYSVLVCTGNLNRADSFSMELSGRGIASAIDSDKDFTGVHISSGTLSRGFIFHEEKVAVIGSGNLFNKSVVEKRSRPKKQSFFTAPERGDYCVHETHGIGRVLGNKMISTTEGTKDYISVEYSGGDVLYIPVEQMDILTRYLGGEKKPRLSKIGGADFERIKNSVRESIKKMSFDLKKLYGERSALKGYAFTADSELEKAFDAAFPFEETVDQLSADEDIKKDMESGEVMDRLVCGDVGFGKTEVAFRAVFRTVVNGKQAALLAPTTILTEQHFNTACERFKNFGVRIACLNRFRSVAEQHKIIEKVKNGEIDFIIGTHRLLSKDIAFKDLGLLVLDEEQRFGVEHKEKIKLLKKNVDALTLTATPIPRTLHMSLTGIREISTINTPPKKRLPVQTYVTEETDALIKDVITREVNRGGQAFILYNRVESIFSFSERVQALMPKFKITVVHGQMEEKAMERGVLAFYNGETDVLISTTIIENGIDLPKANSLIVIDADKLGLSTLYQLKGRVGRSDRLAYAYFTFKREKIISTTAYERLNAIIEFTEMGSGIKIAMRDLEIRGAGNILGAEQHGHMDKIGYELYSKLLREEITGKEEKIPDLDVRLSAFIPENYIESNTSRMDAYKEIAEISDDETEKAFEASVSDAYGELPEEVVNLINISAVKRLSMKLSSEAVVLTRDEASVTLSDFKVFKNAGLQRALDEFSGEVSLDMSAKPKLVFARKGESNAAMLVKMKRFLAYAE